MRLDRAGSRRSGGIAPDTVTNLEIGRYADEPQTLAIIESSANKRRHRIYRREWRRSRCSIAQSPAAKTVQIIAHKLVLILRNEANLNLPAGRC